MNVLDLRCPVLSVIPDFLTRENYQVLPNVRDIVLSRGTAERVAAPPQEWNEWKNVLE